MAEKARIFHVDDDPGALKDTKITTRMSGHDVVLTAQTVAQALSYIPDTLIEKKVNFALIDGELPDGSGDIVAKAIRASGLPIFILALSGKSQIFGDLNLKKEDGPRPLLEAINNFLKPVNPNPTQLRQ